MSAAETPSADPMDLAVRAALRGVRGANPLVGAVLTDEAGRVLAVGHHRGRGTAHAEVDALTRWRAARATDSGPGRPRPRRPDAARHPRAL